MWDQLQKLIEVTQEIPRPLFYSIATIGFFQIAQRFIRIFSGIYRNFIIKPNDLLDRYGRGSWALVTGGGQGIGKAYCYMLAKFGFNIIVLDQHPTAIDTANEVSLQFQVKSRHIIADLLNITEATMQIENMIKDIDISVLVNNAGINQITSCFHKLSSQHISDVININAIAPIIMARCIIPHMLERQNEQGSLQKSAIIFNCSQVALYAAPFRQIYSGTKTMLKGFACALAEEYRGIIDIVSQCPASVDTPMVLRPAPGDLVKPEDSIYGTLNALGREDVTIGAAWHDFYYGVLEMIYGKEGIEGNYLYNFGKRFVENDNLSNQA